MPSSKVASVTVGPLAVVVFKLGGFAVVAV